jgi:hypothetical protein
MGFCGRKNCDPGGFGRPVAELLFSQETSYSLPTTSAHLESFALLAQVACSQAVQRIVGLGYLDFLEVVHAALLALDRAVEDSTFRPRRHVLRIVTTLLFVGIQASLEPFSVVDYFPCTKRLSSRD